ncbi:MAG: D-alanyl-D-alanine carboxypeptidase/D-alanyl-D-alanine-endopeptidase [Bacteroidales bacterium]|nr:D-alanyl-D-alanine carboxypeptidase/D-alanyl-D-alanine-endopeptidase [Bacteroidales bacterium]
MKKTFLSLLVALVAVAGQALNRESAQRAIDAFGGDTALAHGSVTVALYDIEADTMVAAFNPDLSCITASTMKTVTSSSALCLMGPNFKFKTPVYLIGEQKGKKFKGSIHVVGAGDPTLGSAYFPENPNFVAEIIAQLKARGIEKFEGEITVDTSLIPWPASHGWWEVGDLGWSYGMGIHGFNFFDNRSYLKFTAKDGEIFNAHFEPAVPGVQIINRFISKESVDNIDLRLEEGTPALVLHGTAANKDYSMRVAIPTPSTLFVDSLQRAMVAEGFKVKIKPGALAKVKNAQKVQILEHQSPKLADIITSLLDRSDNMFTEGLLRAIAVHTGHKGTWEAGVAVVDSLWRSKGIDTRSVFQRDGSGLACANKISGRFFVHMLSYMAKHPIEGVRLSQLMPPVRRRIGKLIPETPLAENMVVKSGSINAVQCFVGYFPAKRPKYAWALLANNWIGTRADLRDKMDVMLISLFGQSEIE